MKKIKLVYVCECLGGGVRKHLVDLLNHLDKQKYEIHVIYSENRMDAVFAQSITRLNKVSFHIVPQMEREINIAKDFVSFKKIVKLFKKIGPDVVHCHSSKAGVLGRVASRYCGIDTVYYTPHGYIIQNPKISNKKRRLFSLIEKVLAKQFTTKVIHVSKGEEEVALKNNILNKEKSLVIYNGMDIPQTKENKINENFNIITVARMDEQKNPWEAIKIIEALVKKYPEIKYTYVGDGEYYQEISDYIKDNGLDRNIKLQGFMDNPINLLEKADLFLLTSLYEGLPYALIESLACGVPLLATDVTGNNELVINNLNGFLYKQSDLEDGRYKLELLINNKEQLLKMSDNAFQYFLSHFTFDKMMKSYDDLYTQL
ncbi:glycosyltransferase family 1 protein [Priestia megaterium]|uniref:glycosyltransferase family 4 protein n=1 Tax=Priestia megaterium TaxID=1404 RepID=UPI000BF86596|nr:glycosyltransferase family 4 protein [Priestia megaterium]PFP52909.1 glycosyltransferase family 1 protein [Priestia megaterium]PGX17050.1 glycosyltransferase family 1 protein [Priestia megaterium]